MAELILLYSFDPSTGEVIGQPLPPNYDREGNPLRPAFTTFDPAPSTGPRESALFLDDSGEVSLDGSGTWCIKPDWRGVQLWDTATGKQVAITTIGQTPDMVGATGAPCPGEEYRWDGTAWTHDDAKAAEMASATRKTEIVERLSAIDAASIRPLRAVLAGRATDVDKVCLSALEEEADKLRKELTVI